MGGTAESVVIPVTIQVSGEDKVKSLTRTLEKLSKGANFNKYWGSYQNIIDGVTASFEQYTNALSRGDKAASNNFGKEMIKNLNALDAALELSGKKIEDFDFKGFDIKNIRNTATELMKNTDMENIGLKFSKDNFKDFGVAFEYMKSFSGEIGNIFDQLSRSSSDNTIIKQLQEDAISAKEAISDLKTIIEEQKTELQSFESGEKFSQMTDDYEKAMNDLIRAEDKLVKIKETAKSEFKAFLDANNLDSDEHYGDFSEYFEQIESGYLKTSQEAIRALKGSQDAYLLGQNMDIDTTQLQQFIAILEKCVSSVTEVKSEVTQLAEVVNTLGTKAPLENLADSISKSEDITEEQRAKLTAMASGSQDLNSVAQIISVISSTSKEAEGSMEGFYNTITQLVEALQGLGNVNFDSLKKIGGIFESITSLNGFNTKESSFTALLDFLTKLNELEATGNAKLFSDLDFSGLNNIKIKPETSNSIVSLIDAMNGANLSGVNGLNLEWLEKLKIGKTALNSLTSLKEFLNDIRDIDTSGLSTASGLNFDWVEKLSIKSGALKSLEQLKSFLSAVNGSDLSSLESGLKNVKFDEISKYINENIKPIDTSKLIGDTGISAESGALTSLVGAIDQVIEAVGRKNNAFLEEQSVVTGVVDSELTTLGTLWATIDDIATAAKGIDPGKMFSTESFNKMVENIKKFPDSGFDTLKDLGKIDLSKLSFNVKGKSFGNLSEGLKEISQIGDLSKLKALSDVDLSGFSDIKVSGKSFSNLVEGIKELSSLNLDELTKLAGIDFTGLNGLQNAGKVGGGLVKQSKNFIDTQNKQIENELKRYRDLGMDEADLQPIKDMRELLNSNFTPSAMLDMTDVNGEMASFVSMLSEAVNKCDSLAASMKTVKTTTESASADFTKYKNLLNKEKSFLDKKMKHGGLTDLESIDFKEVSDQRRSIEAKYRGDQSQQAMFDAMTERRKAVYKQYKESFFSDIDAYTKTVQETFKGLTSDDYVNGDSFSLLNSKISELIELKEKCQNANVVSDKDIEQANNLKETIFDLKRELQPKVTKNGNFLAKYTDITDAKTAMERVKNMLSEEAIKNGTKISFGDYKKNYTELAYTLKNQNGTLQEYIAKWDQATQSISSYLKKESEYVSQGKQFISSIKGKFAELTRYITLMDFIQKGLKFVKSGISAVVDINTAMTELKKVTDETTESYNTFGKTAGKIAVDIGSTRKDITNSTADYARLGYSMDDATQLAKNTAMYVNVGDGIDITTGTEDLVSIMKAYGINAENSMHIIDVLNEVGNNFAISSSGIGESLKRSSSAMAAANNTFEETVAMATAMNEVLQDPALSGQTLKILSLRLRGAKVELEETGEDTEGMAESTSKLREQIMALTNVDGKGGFDIMKNGGTEFKSTYDMLKGISEVWNDINDVDRAGLLELIAGKNRAQGASALLSNFSQAEAALQTALGSEGSAAKENEKYLDSIQGKVNQLSASFQNLWANAIDDSFIGFLVDVGSSILQLIDKFGMMKVAVGTLAAAFSLNGVGRANAFLNSCLSY